MEMSSMKNADKKASCDTGKKYRLFGHNWH